MRTLIFVLAITCLALSVSASTCKSGSSLTNCTSVEPSTSIKGSEGARRYRSKSSIRESQSPICPLGYGRSGANQVKYPDGVRETVCRLALSSGNKACEAFCLPSNLEVNVLAPPTRYGSGKKARNLWMGSCDPKVAKCEDTRYWKCYLCPEHHSSVTGLSPSVNPKRKRNSRDSALNQNGSTETNIVATFFTTVEFYWNLTKSISSDWVLLF